MNKRGNRGGYEAEIDRFLAVKRNRWIILGGLGGLVLCLFGVLLVLIIREFYLPAATTAPTLTPAVSGQGLSPQDSTATEFTPTPACTDPWLVVGSARYPVQFISPAADGSLSLPPNPSDGTAYAALLVPGQYVFLFAPTQAGLALVQSAKPGDIITTGGTNCAEESFTLAAPEAVPAYSAALWNGQSAGALILLLGTDGGQSILIRGGEVPEQVVATDIPNPQSVEAEISLEDASTTLAGKLRVKLSINNYGASAITLTAADVSVIPTGGSPLAVEDGNPNLPLTIAPGAVQSLALTFPKPETPTALLRIFTIEYDLSGY
jgi:hypothetical protein